MKIIVLVVLVILCIFNLSIYIKYLYNNLIKKYSFFIYYSLKIYYIKYYF